MSFEQKLAKHRRSSADTKKARELRNAASFVERKLWRGLSVQAKFTGFHFRRQHPIHPYIVDFICLAAHLIIEIDGPSHDTAQAYDEQREKALRKAGFDVVRFSNEAVCKNVEGVVEVIITEARRRLETILVGEDDPHPNPPLKGEGTGPC